MRAILFVLSLALAAPALAQSVDQVFDHVDTVAYHTNKARQYADSGAYGRDNVQVIETPAYTIYTRDNVYTAPCGRGYFLSIVVDDGTTWTAYTIAGGCEQWRTNNKGVLIE